MDELFDLTGAECLVFGPQDSSSSIDTHTELLFQILEKVTVLQYQIEQMQKESERNEPTPDPESQSMMLDFVPFDPFEIGGL